MKVKPLQPQSTADFTVGELARLTEKIRVGEKKVALYDEMIVTLENELRLQRELEALNN